MNWKYISFCLLTIRYWLKLYTSHCPRFLAFGFDSVFKSYHVQPEHGCTECSTCHTISYFPFWQLLIILERNDSRKLFVHNFRALELLLPVPRSFLAPHLVLQHLLCACRPEVWWTHLVELFILLTAPYLAENRFDGFQFFLQLIFQFNKS